MTFTDFDRAMDRECTALKKAKKKDELLMASSTLSGPASVSRQRANSKTDPTKPVPRHCLTPWQYDYFSSYCPRRCRAISTSFDSSAVSRILPSCSDGRTFDRASFVLCVQGMPYALLSFRPKARTRERITYDRQHPCSLTL